MFQLLPLNPTARTRRYQWLAGLFLFGVLVILSLPGAVVSQLADFVKALLNLPPSPDEPALLPVDKIVHAGLFLVAGALLARGWHGRKGVWWLLAAALLLFAGLTEVIQSFVPGRSAAWGDLLADGLGAGAGLAVARRVLPGRVADFGRG